MSRFVSHPNSDISSLLEVRHLSVDYVSGSSPLRAVDDLSFRVEENQIFGLAGESGSGKSTTAMAILRLLQSPALISKGSAYFRGVDIFEMNECELRAFRWKNISVVFQSAMNSLNPVMTIGAQITDVILTHTNTKKREALERAADLLMMVGLASTHLKSYPHQLSGGMRQRVTIAMALALDPPLLFMDEPTTALDVVVQKELLQEISELRQKLGFSILFISHDLNLMFEFCDTIGILYAGRFCEIAPTQQLKERPLHPYTQGLLNSSPSLYQSPENLRGIVGSPPRLRALPPGCRFHPRCSLADSECSSTVPQLSLTSSQHQVACLHSKLNDSNEMKSILNADTP